MAETQTPALKPAMANQADPNSKPAPKRGPPLHEIYALPAPIRTFPLPSFYPNNPLSLFHVAYAWLRQAFSPPPAEPAMVHEGTWSAATTSVHITDEKSVRALWEQGFYGKGSLSRSEPNWLRRELVRRGLQESHVSEILTVQRREERIRAKWERARLEQEAIRETREAEAREAERRRLAREAAKPPQIIPKAPSFVAPVGPLELLALPNSGIASPVNPKVGDSTDGLSLNGYPPDVTAKSISSMSHSTLDQASKPLLNGDAKAPRLPHASMNGNLESTGQNGTLVQEQVVTDSSSSPNATARVIPGLHKLKGQKSVRFSPKVESTTFQISDPPSPNLSPHGNKLGSPVMDGTEKPGPRSESPTVTMVNKEHLQLMPEESLWLSFGLGALAVTDPASGLKLSPKELLTLFRQHCYFPPRTGPDDPDLQPDDDFLLHYAVYHHFRSLGWVPRAGIKFGVDWLLYTKGPVFDHAEFGIVVIPSYSDPWWKQAGKRNPQKSWQWLHSIVRVLSQVMKSLVIVYVDVPPPQRFDEALEVGFSEALKLYTIREVMVKRWSSNRNR